MSKTDEIKATTDKTDEIKAKIALQSEVKEINNQKISEIISKLEKEKNLNETLSDVLKEELNKIFFSFETKITSLKTKNILKENNNKNLDIILAKIDSFKQSGENSPLFNEYKEEKNGDIFDYLLDLIEEIGKTYH